MTEKGKAKTQKKIFSRTTTISQNINADAEVIWGLLTNPKDYNRWNSTIISLEGKIEVGGKIELKSTLDPKRTFKLKVKEMFAPTKMVWGDGIGNRTYTLKSEGNSTLFSMTEKIGGPIFPLFGWMIPSFDESFEQYVKDLKKEAELIKTK